MVRECIRVRPRFRGLVTRDAAKIKNHQSTVSAE
jgi:hypothetical protein